MKTVVITGSAQGFGFEMAKVFRKNNFNVVLSDINEKQLNLMAEKYGVPKERCFLDKDEMLKALPEIDIVSVCTWNSAHAECTIAALNAGKNVLCEKPMAMNTKQAEEMLEAAKKNNKLLQIGFVRRYGNDADVMKDFIDAGYFGDIYYAKATYLRRNGNPGGLVTNPVQVVARL